jgi:Tfp pilus assembly protein PilF
MPSPARSNGAPNPRWASFACIALIGAVFLAYANGLHAPFVFDDLGSIHDNPSIRRLVSPEIFSPPSGQTVTGRPLVNATLAVNYAFGGEDVDGYHALNIAIHALAACVLLGLLRRTLLMPTLRARFGGDAGWLAFAVAAVWALHPLQTESVTYIVQRAESLMGLCYLLTLYAFARSADSRHPVRWRAICVLACALGMASKEVMVSAPLAVVAYDRIFVSGSWREGWRRHRRVYLALASTWLLLAVLVVQSDGRANTAGFGAGVSPLSYALVQCQAITHYLRLAFWPAPLVFDYGPYASPTSAAWIWAVPIVSLLGGAVWLLRRAPAAGFAALLFFAALAPTSSVLPIESEVMAEHRMYLALAPLVALVTLAAYARFGRRSLIVFFVAATAAAVGTVRRNEVYRREEALWTSSVEAYPQNPRAHCALAKVLAAKGDLAGAEQHLRRALALRSDYVDAANQLGTILADQHRFDEAEAQYRELLRRKPREPQTLINLGVLELRQNHLDAAANDFQQALEERPRSAIAQNNLGTVRFQQGDFAAARRHHEAALAIDPDYADAWYNLGNVHAQENRLSDARWCYEAALRLDPDLASAHANLGGVLAALGQRGSAIEQLREALRLRPDYPVVQRKLSELEGR